MAGKARIVKPTVDAELRPASLVDLPTADDHLGFAPYVRALERFLTNKDTHGPLTISIEGEWGSGKSSFMEQLIATLRVRAKDTGARAVIVKFNAWRHDNADELWASFALEFIRQIARDLSWYERWKGHAKLAQYRFKWGEGWPDVASALLWVGAAILILAGFHQGVAKFNDGVGKLVAWIGIGVTSAAVIVTAVTWIAQRIGNPLQIDLGRHIKSPDYEQRVSFLEHFHEDFAKVLRAYIGNNRVFVFVDDLDRCEIPKAAELMQALNLMLSGNNDYSSSSGWTARKSQPASPSSILRFCHTYMLANHQKKHIGRAYSLDRVH